MIVRGGRTGCKLLEVIISIVELYFDHKCKQSGAKGVCVSPLFQRFSLNEILLKGSLLEYLNLKSVMLIR